MTKKSEEEHMEILAILEKKYSSDINSPYSDVRQVFSSVSTTVFSTYSCDYVEDLGVNLLRADYSVSCDNSEHLFYEVNCVLREYLVVCFVFCVYFDVLLILNCLWMRTFFFCLFACSWFVCLCCDLHSFFSLSLCVSMVCVSISLVCSCGVPIVCLLFLCARM